MNLLQNIDALLFSILFIYFEMQSILSSFVYRLMNTTLIGIFLRSLRSYFGNRNFVQTGEVCPCCLKGLIKEKNVFTLISRKAKI